MARIASWYLAKKVRFVELIPTSTVAIIRDNINSQGAKGLPLVAVQGILDHAAHLIGLSPDDFLKAGDRPA